jgi:hypothetical protein
MPHTAASGGVWSAQGAGLRLPRCQPLTYRVLVDQGALGPVAGLRRGHVLQPTLAVKGPAVVGAHLQGVHSQGGRATNDEPPPPPQWSDSSLSAARGAGCCIQMMAIKSCPCQKVQAMPLTTQV